MKLWTAIASYSLLKQRSAFVCIANLFIVNTFAKWWLIFKIISLLHRGRNLQENTHKRLGSREGAVHRRLKSVNEVTHWWMYAMQNSITGFKTWSERIYFALYQKLWGGGDRPLCPQDRRLYGQPFFCGSLIPCSALLPIVNWCWDFGVVCCRGESNRSCQSLFDGVFDGRDDPGDSLLDMDHSGSLIYNLTILCCTSRCSSNNILNKFHKYYSSRCTNIDDKYSNAQ